MKLTFANILMLLLAAVGCTSCIYEYGAEPGNPVEDQPNLPGDVYLNLSVGVLTQPGDPTSRANEDDPNTYFESPSSKYERLNTLRIIIVRGERLPQGEGEQTVSPDAGVIEHNQFFQNLREDGISFHEDLIFKVRGGEKKKIYLIANEKYLKDKGIVDFDDKALKVNSVYPENLLENLVLTAGDDNVLFDNSNIPAGATGVYIPMSESYEISVPNPLEYKQYQYEKMFITRAAVKFSFVVNTEDDFPERGFIIKDIKFDGVSGSEYFLPRAKYLPDKYDDSTDPLGGRFVNEYTVPEPTKSLTAFSFPTAIPLQHYTENVDLGSTLKQGLLYAPALYFCESNIPANGKQYTVNITIGKEGTNAGDLTDITFTPYGLTNLSSLPRNTHVVVCITLKQLEGIEATVKLVPYIGVTIDYTFGFDKLYDWDRPINPNI